MKAKERVETADMKFWNGNVRKRIEFSKQIMFCRPSTACTSAYFLVVHRMLRSSDVKHLTWQQ